MCTLYPRYNSCCGIPIRIALIFIAILSIVTGAMINAMLKKAGVNVSSIQDVKMLKNLSSIKFQESNDTLLSSRRENEYIDIYQDVETSSWKSRRAQQEETTTDVQQLGTIEILGEDGQIEVIRFLNDELARANDDESDDKEPDKPLSTNSPHDPPSPPHTTDSPHDPPRPPHTTDSPHDPPQPMTTASHRRTSTGPDSNEAEVNHPAGSQETDKDHTSSPESTEDHTGSEPPGTEANTQPDHEKTEKSEDEHHAPGSHESSEEHTPESVSVPPKVKEYEKSTSEHTTEDTTTEGMDTEAPRKSSTTKLPKAKNETTSKKETLIQAVGYVNRNGLNFLSMLFIALGILLLVANFLNSPDLALLCVVLMIATDIAALLLLLGVVTECTTYPSICVLKNMDWFSGFMVTIFWFIYILVWAFFAAVANSFANGGVGNTL